jgi:hypothetical protein
LEATPVLDIWRRFPRWWESSAHAPECLRVKKKIDYLKRVGGEKQPVFVFAHFLVPHSPIKFDAEGHCIEGVEITRKEAWQQFKKSYVEQIKYISSAIIDIFDTQIRNNINNLVFVIQSDEGPYPISYHLDGKGFNWETATSDDIFMKFGILNAFYFYDRNYNKLNEYSSPVNNFRIILNKTLGSNFPLLEDRAYISKDRAHVFKFTDVTDTVRRLTED